MNNKSCSTGPWKWLWILLVVIVLGSGLLSMKYRPMSSINYEITDVKPMKRLYSNSTWIKEHVSRETCISGHIQNMVPICGADGCLKKLTGPPLDAEVRSGNVRHIALTTKGWMLESHIDTVKFVSQMQWKFGIFGSVGEIGVYYGKFASVLATYTATEYGERFFVCDIFGNPKHMKMKTEEGRKDKFEQAMNQVGFSMYGQNEPKRVRLWDDSSLYLSKMSYKAMGLAAFRFFSIDGNHHEPYVLGDLVHVTCILREGGIIAMDDYGNSKWPGVAEAMTNYVIMYGSKIVVPLLILRSKMYMCTASWYNTYIKYIEQAGIAKKMHWCQRTKNVLGIRSTVYTNC